MDRYELAAQGPENGLWDWDLTTNRLHYSPAWISMLGLAEGDCGSTAQEWFKRIHPEDLEPVKREIVAHLKAGSKQFEIQHRMLHQDGCYRWMSCRGVITRDDRGRAFRIGGCHVDITDEMVVDALTGLPNRILVLNRLSRSIEKARNQADFLYAVLVADLDLGETDSNRLGTLNRDFIMVSAARRLETALRTKEKPSHERRADLVARSGEEEFVILLEKLGELEDAKIVAERLLKVLLAPFTFDGQAVSLSASIGIALSATGYRNPEDALRDANTALYRAKSLGKSRCEVFDTAALLAEQNRHQLEKEFHGALHRKEFKVFYQPIISLTNNQIVGFEALVRWEHPSRGLIMPGEFIPIAEKTGFIIPLNHYVIQDSCRQLKTWQIDPRIPKHLWVSVNLSGRQFTQGSLVKEIRDALLDADLDPQGLMLELTEGIVMEDPEETKSVLMQLRVMGARIALDDFGTGYSSMAYLHRLPLDFLKIDRSFVRSMENTADALEIVRTIKALANQLGLRIIAEGIETTRQLELLRSMSCEFGQGFLYSKAVRAEDAESLLLKGFASREGVSLPVSSAEENKPGNSLQQAIPPMPDVLDPAQGYGWRRILPTAKKWIPLGLTVLILLSMGILLAAVNRWFSPPGFPAAADNPGKAVSSTENDQTPPARASQTAPAVVPKTAKVKAPESVYNYPVQHDHCLGSCKGTLRITRDAVLFVSENKKHSFELKHSQCSCVLDGDQLSVKTGSKVYNFKSAIAFTKDENRSHLLDIFQKISRFHPDGSSAAR
jgi:diguanylate cyclase (GGDEF)-like protein